MTLQPPREKSQNRTQNHLLGILLLILVSAGAYLPLVGTFGYFNDDWYLMYAASAYGPEAFVDIFSVDRPGRALVMIPAYRLFGGNPLYYSLSAYIFRVIGGLAFFWLLNMLWPGRRRITTLSSLLFLIYPGFLSQPNAIDYQSHIFGLAAALLSIALTLRAIFSTHAAARWILHGAAIVLGWLYLSQMEWYIGFEFFRWACVFLLSSRLGGTFLQRGRRAVQWAYPSLLVPLAFLIWRLYFFESERGATDTDVQLELFRLYPLQTIFHWTVQIGRDLFDVILSAWVLPLSQLMGYVQWWGIALALAAAVGVFFWSMKSGDPQPEGSNFTREALLLGLSSAAAGLLPIAMANREVAFPFFSRYSLVSSAGVSIFLLGIFMAWAGRTWRSLLAAGMVLIALLTHHANSVQHARVSDMVRRFWWQVSWRVPQLAPRTTLIGSYPIGATEEDYFIWGPANLIYYPEKQSSENIQPGVYASVLNRGTVLKVLARERQKLDNRKTIITYPNHRNILILTQPTLSSCVHIVDGLQPAFSQWELDTVREIGPYSELEHVLLDEAPHTPPSAVFGTEPFHGWCYYYQKADLARQRGDWKEVITLGEQAIANGFSPTDSIEWMPFLEAYARTGAVTRLSELAPTITASPYVAQQACQMLSSLTDTPPPATEAIRALYCLK